MRKTLSNSMMAVAFATAIAVFPATIASAQAPATPPAPVADLQTPWGEPDLQGIWTDETDTPLQRPARFANQQFFTATQRAELDGARAAVLGRDSRAQRGTEDDVASGSGRRLRAESRGLPPRLPPYAPPCRLYSCCCGGGWRPRSGWPYCASACAALPLPFPLPPGLPPPHYAAERVGASRSSRAKSLSVPVP